MAHTGDIVLILDFGSQYTQLIARRVRELGVYAEILTCNVTATEIQAHQPKALILSGGPASVYAKDAPRCAPEVFTMGLPTLGLCYGLQLMAHELGGEVEKSDHREYGRAEITTEGTSKIFKDVPARSTVWMSHGDSLRKAPKGFRIIASSTNAPLAALTNEDESVVGLQFHPEVVHTEFGTQILSNFLFEIAHLKADWNPQDFIEATIADIKQHVGDKSVICALSGGVDSAVAAVLVHRAIGKQLKCIHIDNGLMRRGESAEVVHTFRDHFGIDLDFHDASELFLSRLEGVTDPEQKRKIIGKAFIDVLAEEAEKFLGSTFLVQGTIYPDVIESLSSKSGRSATIKSHHNVGGLPADMNLKLIEPLRELFKDEVRNVGRALGIPEHFIDRHPFPGPGLAIRVIGAITREKLELLRASDSIFIEELRANNLYSATWQAFTVVLPIQTVGVMGDERTYENVVSLRAVTSVDGMTADWARLPHEFLAHVSNRIANEVRGLSRVVYDISSKPPATIEWE